MITFPRGSGDSVATVRRVRLLLGVGLAVIGASVPAGSAVAAPAQGQAVFDSLCAGCHTVGGGKKVGPDLAGLPDRVDRAWAEKFILAPQDVIASGDPTAKKLVSEYGMPMPDVGVTAAQIGPLLAFLGYKGGQAPAPTPAPAPAPAPAPKGDAERGKHLFTGAERLSAGGPACLSCHSVAGVGALGGGALGPDLTGAYKKYGGAQGLGSALEGMTFPTMAPIFGNRALTPVERVDLVAFLNAAPTKERTAGAAGKLIVLSVGLAVLIVLAALAIWRRRLGGVRRPLVSRAREG